MLNKYIIAVLISSISLYAPLRNAQAYPYDGYMSYDDGYAQPYPKKMYGKKYKVKRSSGGIPSKISSGNIVKVNLRNLSWAAYDGAGNLVRSGRASGGKSYCPDLRRGCRTVTGTYTFYSKQGAGCKSRRFPVGRGGARMPYCMFFRGGYALHGSNAVPGYNASHGCVRVPPEDAQWLNHHFVRLGSTRISIHY